MGEIWHRVSYRLDRVYQIDETGGRCRPGRVGCSPSECLLGKEREVVQQLQSGHGKQYDAQMVCQNQKDVASMLGES